MDPMLSLQTLFDGKWRPAVLRQLVDGPLRLSQLRRALPSCSKKVLIDTLHSLERIGWVERREYDTKVRRVDYVLTEAHAAKLRSLFSATGEAELVALSSKSQDPPHGGDAG